MTNFNLLLMSHAVVCGYRSLVYVETKHHARNQKYIMYCTVTRGPSHGQVNKNRKFCEVWRCGLWDMSADI